MTRGPEWVVFDYGEVICRRTSALPRLSTRLGVAPGPFAEAYWRERPAYDAGLSDLEFWHAVGAGLGVTVDEGAAADLTRADIDGWLDVDQDVIALLGPLHDAGVNLALLSNAPSSMGRAVEIQPWARLFQHLLFSGDVGVAKPAPAIWSVLIGALGSRPEDCLFLDDRQENVDGARRAGLRAELWPGTEGGRAILARLELA